MLQGEVSQTVILGGTSDISQFWVVLRDEPIQYPDKNPILGRYLGPEIDVGPKITAKIMRVNGEVLHQSTYRGLKEEEWTNQSRIQLRKESDSNIKDRYGPDISPGNFPDINWRVHPCMRCMRNIPQMCRVVWQAGVRMMRPTLWIMYWTTGFQLLK